MKQQKNKKLGGITGKGFKPGQSGNYSGRPKGLAKGIRDREGLKSFNRLLQIRDDVEEDTKEVLSACKIILGYCWGQPSQTLEIQDLNLPDSLKITGPVFDGETKRKRNQSRS